MSAPTIDYAYLSHDRYNLYVVCRIDSGVGPIKALTGGGSWTVKVNGVTTSVSYLATVADPRANIINLDFDTPFGISDVVTISLANVTGSFADQFNQVLTPVLPANAITVLACLPVIDLIARDIAARISEITTASDYLFNLSVVDDLKDPQRIGEGLALVTYDDPAVEDSPPLGHEQFTANFHINITTAVSSASDRPITSKEYQIEAEVMKLLQVDYGRNGLAVDTLPLAPARIVFGIGGWGGVQVNAMVRYRTLYGDRFSQ